VIEQPLFVFDVVDPPPVVNSPTSLRRSLTVGRWFDVSKMVELLVVGGSPTVRRLIADELNKSKQVQVVGVAATHPSVEHTDRRTVAVVEATSDATASLALSRREVQVLACVAEGRSNTQAALALFVSPETVKTHLRRVFEKLDVSNRADAVTRGVALGLIDAPTCWQKPVPAGRSTSDHEEMAKELQ